MFYAALKFNQPLNNWNISNVNNMQHVIVNAISYKQPISNFLNFNLISNKNKVKMNENLYESFLYWEI